MLSKFAIHRSALIVQFIFHDQELFEKSLDFRNQTHLKCSGNPSIISMDTKSINCDLNQVQFKLGEFHKNPIDCRDLPIKFGMN